MLYLCPYKRDLRGLLAPYSMGGYSKKMTVHEPGTGHPQTSNLPVP